MKKILTDRVLAIKPSPTLEITAKAGAMKAKGIDIVNFGAGEPDFDTPLNIKDAAISAIKAGYTKYTPVGGIDKLKEAVAEKLLNDNGLSYSKDEILISCGAKHTLYNIAQAIFEKGDEVIIPSPYWVTYPDQVILSDATPVIVDTSYENRFIMTPELFEKHITDKTKAVIINSPSNPSGVAYKKDELYAIAKIAVKNDILIISDEIYEKMVYDNFKHISIASLGDDIKRKTILVNGLSKSHSMTGWRIGYAAGDKNIISAMNTIQSQSTSNPTSISQYAAVEALKGDQGDSLKMVKAFEERRNYIVKRLNAIKGVSCLNPDGAFYVFPNMSGLYNRKFNDITVKDSLGLSDYLLKEALVAVVPGAAFGMDNYIRLSYATSMEMIKKGLDRIEKALS